MSRGDVLVLGAGMVGVCTAWHLLEQGFNVVLLDRGQPGVETSFGNAGLIQREAVEPYVFPRQWRKILGVVLGQGADIHYHLSAMPSVATALWTYFRFSRPDRHAHQSRAYSRLIACALDDHQSLIARSGADALITRRGYHRAYRSEAAFDTAARDAQRLQRQYGLQVMVQDSAALAQAEPALRRPMAGAILWADAWSVQDPGDLVQAYARLYVRNGGVICQGDAASLQAQGGGWRVRSTGGDWLRAQHAVVALGPWSHALARELGYRLPLFAKRGYHQHYAAGERLQRPLLDAERGYVLAPMRRGMRLTTGAEFARVDAPATPVQVGRALALAQELLDLREPLDHPPWLGARPCTADMLPVMGPAPRHTGLWFNFGHAHQGFTLGPTAGRLLATMIRGEPTALDMSPYLPARFV
jgi:D-amino-acid dehydrogenase